jgi:hypothetical protein
MYTWKGKFSHWEACICEVGLIEEIKMVKFLSKVATNETLLRVHFKRYLEASVDTNPLTPV